MQIQLTTFEKFQAWVPPFISIQEVREDNIFYVKFIGILKVKNGEEFLQGNR